jgi:hypothetical protein
MDFPDLIYDNFNKIIKIFIEGPKHFLLILFIFIIYLANRFGFLIYPGKDIMFVLLIVSFLVNRKTISALMYVIKFKKYFKILNSGIKTKKDFKIAYSYYYWFCLDNNLKILKPGIGLAYTILNLYYCLILNSIEINVTTGKEDDLHHREELNFISFICVLCDLVSSYDVRQHYLDAPKLTDKLRQIYFDNFLIKIFMECYSDGKGFMSTVVLGLLIMIYLKSPFKKRNIIKNFYAVIPEDDYGWLNRKLFESIIIIVMMEENPFDELNIIKEKLESTKFANDDDKYQFRNEILPRRLYKYGIKYAD